MPINLPDSLSAYPSECIPSVTGAEGAEYKGIKDVPRSKVSGKISTLTFSMPFKSTIIRSIISAYNRVNSN